MHSDVTLKKESTSSGKIQPAIRLWAICGELGLLIAIPLVIMVLIGLKIDRTLGTLPLFLIVALVTSPMLSGIAIWRKIKRMNV